MPPKPTQDSIGIETLHHPADVTRRNIPTAETSGLMADAEAQAPPLRYPRNPDLDPQLVWRGKDAQDAEDLQVPTVPIYIQEKVLPEALIRDLQRQTRQGVPPQADFFGSFDRIHDPEAKLEFYGHAENWSNRMILGDSLLVMNSLAEKEGLRGQVQMIYLDPPYGIKFGSNWQPSTRTREVKEGKAEGVSRQPEQVKAFRDTWKDGINSYLSFWRDRMVVARELLAESGSIFVQIGDENVHRVRALMDEVFGPDNCVALIVNSTTTSSSSQFLDTTADYIIWYAKNRDDLKFRQLLLPKAGGATTDALYRHITTSDGCFHRNSPISEHDDKNQPRVFRIDQLTSQTQATTTNYAIDFEGLQYNTGKRQWATPIQGMKRLISARRVIVSGSSLAYVRHLDDFNVTPLRNIWTDTGTGSFTDAKIYVVQSGTKAIQRCVLMATDPGDLVLDPTCGSGTTAVVAEQWGRRWITIDTSRVALALARTRLMAARHPAYLLRDSGEGAVKSAELTGMPPEEGSFQGDIRQGFVLERVLHVTLKSIANNAEIDVIHTDWQPKLDTSRAAWNAAQGTAHEEWQIPRTLPNGVAPTARETHAAFWQARRQRQAAMDASIARNADVEYLHDRPYPKRGAVRVTGPFTVESLSPHRVLPADEAEDEALLNATAEDGDAPPRRPRPRPNAARPDAGDDFVTAVLDNLAKAGVQNTKKNERLHFATIRPWPGGGHVAAEATYEEAGQPRRAAIAIGPEYGTVGQDLVRDAVRECRDWADSLVVCGFAFDPQVGETTMNLGRLPVLKARMS